MRSARYNSTVFSGISIIVTLIFLYIFFFFFSSGNHNQQYYYNNRLAEVAEPPAPAPALPPAPHPVAISRNEKTRKKTSLKKIERDLALARAAIREAVQNRNYTTSSSDLPFVPTGPVYRNAVAFYQSYVEMEKRLKIWAYEEGERPIMHQGPMNNIYGIEGHLIEELESGLSRFKAKNAGQAHVFFMPWSIANVVHFLYRPLISYSRDPLHRVVLDYVTLVAQRHPFWNRSVGADHFMVSCHDWGPDVSRADKEVFKNLIRGLCNANTTEGFKPERDISIPEVKIPVGKLGPPESRVRISKRTRLAFFAGGAHGHVRKMLFHHWKDKDDMDIQVHEYLPNNQNYFKLLGEAKFCLCPSGYEVASPRVVEAIHADCVPVLISDNYSLPFSDVLDWTKFSLHLSVSDIPHLKTKLQAISTTNYLRLVKGLRSVKCHFTLNRPAKPFDLIHMMLHSLWLRRLNLNLLSSSTLS